jgi:RNA polymerase sigma-70 factor (ECF subfamily)
VLVGLAVPGERPTIAAGQKSAAAKADTTILKYGDGKADGRKSLGGTGETIHFEMPDGVTQVRGIKIHGSRYGSPQPPKEDFDITFVKDDFSELSTPRRHRTVCFTGATRNGSM